jgi:hypothetical protein
MITVNSLSGGKTSSYIAANYPADVDIFALVCIDDHNANANTNYKLDAKMIQAVNDKLQKHCSHMPEFIATAEDPMTIKTMFDLEQHIGREIIWVRGIGYDSLIKQNKFIPNQRASNCTTVLKIEPIFRCLYMYYSLPCEMRIGYRADESHRTAKFTENFKFAFYSQLRNTPKKGGKGPTEHFQRLLDVVYRIGVFPLVEDDIWHIDIQKYWELYKILFPEDTNCQFCFHKRLQQLKQNGIRNPSIAMWAAIQEEMMNGNTFHKDWSILEIQNVNVQQDLFGKSHGGCHGGYCIN